MPETISLINLHSLLCKHMRQPLQKSRFLNMGPRQDHKYHQLLFELMGPEFPDVAAVAAVVCYMHRISNAKGKDITPVVREQLLELQVTIEEDQLLIHTNGYRPFPPNVTKRCNRPFRRTGNQARGGFASDLYMPFLRRTQGKGSTFSQSRKGILFVINVAPSFIKRINDCGCQLPEIAQKAGAPIFARFPSYLHEPKSFVKGLLPYIKGLNAGDNHLVCKAPVPFDENNMLGSSPEKVEAGTISNPPRKSRSLSLSSDGSTISIPFDLLSEDNDEDDCFNDIN